MNDFVDQCRGEWKRLGVPDPVADEMAAELTADLDEAAAEGVPAVEVLGAGAYDARAFAASWAAERGIVPPSAGRLPRRTLPTLAALALVLAIVGAALVIVDSGSAPNTVALAPPGSLPFRVRLPGAKARLAKPATLWVAPRGFSPGVTAADGGDTRTIGSVLLAVGLIGLVPFVVLSLSGGFGRSLGAH